MPQKRRIYDDEFKRDAVRLVTHNSSSVKVSPILLDDSLAI